MRYLKLRWSLKKTNLNRPLLLEDGHDSLKLFATNDEVDDSNRDMLLKTDGPVDKYISQDNGKTACLNDVLAPHKL